MASKTEISVQEYSNILKTVELENICLLDASFKLDKNKINGQIKLEVKESAKFEMKENNFSFIYKNSLVGKNQDKDEAILYVSTIHELIFKTTLNTEIPKQFFDKFKIYSVSAAIWPYFREFVQNMISRSQLPPLSLPLRKIV